MDDSQSQCYITRQRNPGRFSNLFQVYLNDCLPVQGDTDIKMRVLEMSRSNLVNVRNQVLRVVRLHSGV
jgi:hypothetical protein